MITTGNSNGPLGFGDEDEEDKVVEDLENGTDKRSSNDRREEVLADPVQFSNAPHVSPDQGDHTKPPTGGDEVITPREGEGGEQIVRQIPSSSHIPVDSEGEDQARSTEGMAGPASSVVEQGLGNLAGSVFTIGHDILPSSRRTSSPVHPSDPSNEPLATTVPSSDDEMPRPTARLPRATRAASSQAGSTSIERMRRRVPVVEIPLMPLDRIRQYINVPRSSLPTLQSRHKLLNESISVDTSSRASSSRPRPVRAAARRGSSSRKQSSPLFTGDSDEFGGYGSEDDEDEIFEAETGNSESDVVLLRRSGRGPEPEKVIRKSARVAKRSPCPRILKMSSVSEESFYGGRRKGKMPHRSSLRTSARKMRKMEDVDEGTGSDYKQKSMESDDECSEALEGGSLGEVSMEALSRHRSFCEKCSRGPADEMLERALKRKRKSGKKRKKNDDEVTDEELARDLEGWMECEKCVVVSHWGCLSESQKKDALVALLDKEGTPPEGQRKRKSVGVDEAWTFVCSRCSVHPKCFVCHEETVKPEDVNLPNGRAENEQGSEPMQIDGEEGGSEPKMPAPLLFRCWRCKQAVHYEHLKRPKEKMSGTAEVAESYQYPTDNGGDGWFCHECRDWVWTVDIICAWRPLPAGAEQIPPDGKPNYKDQLAREYLVKWTGRGFRHVTWVPHTWLLAMSSQKLRFFLERGPSLDLVTDETLAARGDELSEPTIARVMEEDDRVHGQKTSHHAHGAEWAGQGPAPDMNAEAAIPMAWRTIDRMLDIMLLPPVEPKSKKKAVPSRRSRRVLSESATSESSDYPVLLSPTILGESDGLEPPANQRMEIEEWERKTGRVLTGDDSDEVAGLVTWCFVKWDDLQYDQSCWDTPPPATSPLYEFYKRALRRYLRARQVVIPVLTASQCRAREARAEMPYSPPESQPKSIVGGKVMPFQMEGFQWLLYKHFKRESCILADDMGLGKTIQIASVLGYLSTDDLQVYPSLVIVPNSTITNWVREFEKWVPHVRVVPYYGEAASRKIISKYELYHKNMQGEAAGLKAHVVLTTYDMITGADFRVFAGIPRWEVLCVDEGQRLKSDSSLIFNRLKTLNSVHRILLTGTPLNNNLRELFNLLNFLDRDTFKHLSDLEERFEKLNEGLVQELHEMIKPYILRRIKADVLKLPPKVEIIVPISLTPLQKHVYKGILERNADILKTIAVSRRKRIAKASETPNKVAPASSA